ncbi:uncharacterized protein LOC118756451, partial [Rhagoletis pomonella]|uniref:uncharacterized protein LOC118756451 n=1 Tax=Rhagoletis pomonella TaxID=28610 RepID=UPI001783FC77
MSRQRRANSEGDSELNETVIETTTPPRTQPRTSTDNIAALVASITALRDSIIELRNETSTQRADIQQLHERMNDHGGNNTQPVPPPSQPHNTQDIVSTEPHRTSAETITPQPQTSTTSLNNRQPPLFMDNAITKLYPLPVFEGNPEDWPLFIACYRDTTAEFNYGNRQNLIRLQRALKGAARQAVASLMIYPDDVPGILNELEFNFGRSDLLIRAQLQKVQQFPIIHESRLDSILEFSTRVRNVVAFFKSARCEHHLVNPTLLEQLVSKLPPSKQFEWGKRVAELGPFPTVDNFSTWLSELARVISLMPRTTDRSTTSTNSRQVNNLNNSSRQPTIAGGGSRRLLLSHEAPSVRRAQRCVLCSEGHPLSECSQFNGRNPNERWVVVKRHQVCFSCLGKGHSLQNCQKRATCGVNGCQRKHHQLLHTEIEASSNNNNDDQIQRVYNCRQYNESTLFKVFPVTLIGPRGEINIYAMFDEGSSISLISERVASSLGVQGQTSLLSLQWYGKNKTTEKSRKVSIEIRAPYADHTYAIKNVRTIGNLDLPMQSFNSKNFHHLSTMPTLSYIDAKPELLLGLDNSFLGVTHEIIDNGPNQPIAAKTKLGWIVYGPSHETVSTPARVIVVRESHTMKQLHKLVEDYIITDTVASRTQTDTILESDSDIRARKILEENTKCLGGRYEVSLLWKTDDVTLPPSYGMAYKRLLQVEAKMRKDSQFAKCYINEINKYIDKDYAKQLSTAEVNIVKPTTWYLPHFGVVNPHKPDKLRIVFDAAAMTSNVSLNSFLLKGPEKAQSLLTILFKFRQGHIAVAGDIEEMFSQVRIRDEDQDSQRFLWRNGDPSKPIQVYVMKSMIFGAASSPCCAEHVKNVNAAKFESQMPKAVDAVTNKTYVDDLVISFHDAKEAEQTIIDAIKINAAAGFKLRRFVSNCKALEASLNNGNSLQSNKFNLERKDAVDKILGMHWNTTTDNFEFKFHFFKIAKDMLQGERPPTKRELLGIVMSIYDPFGLLTNITISAKLLLQALWKLGVEWDEELPHQLVTQWKMWWAKFQSVKSLTIPRCYCSFVDSAQSVQLHIFVDASTSAYAAAAYLRVQKDDVVEISLVCAKASCAPLKPTTVPRMELQAAVLGCRIKNLVEESLDIPIQRTFLWSDSQTVILWIRSQSRVYKPYVAHRIAEILNTSTTDQWHWVPTNLNVADDATRAKFTSESSSHSRWLNGPDFLNQDEGSWPREVMMSSDECVKEETSRRLLACDRGKILVEFTNFSSFLKLTRVMAWLLRFVNNSRKKTRMKGELKAVEITSAENHIFRLAQRDAYAEAIEDLRQKKSLPKNCSLYPLTPYLDEDDLIKIYGRLDAAYCLPISARRPIILPANHHITHLLVLDYHARRHHQNDNLVINEIRQRFWIPAIRNVLKRIKRNCQVCICDRAKPTAPLMGQLPTDRVTPYVRPFSYSGVDYCGPFHVAIGRRREKRWVALFTCLTTRAVHLEMAENLSTDAFIICLRNFINRRGTPIRMRSDNGTNFVGAQKEMRDENRLFDFNAIEREFAKHKMEWVFNCPADPSSGGCWERLIQCTKRLLHKVLKEEAPRVETLRSVLIEIENIINSRPLTDIPVTAEEEEPLTPNHFLIGCLNSTQTPHPADERICLRKQWKIAQNLKDRAWKRWTIEYLPRLLCRPKWRDDVPALQPGTLVI